MSGEIAQNPLNVLITAGGTIAPIDDVRVISNRSSGRFGSNLAEAWLQAGAEVAYLATSPQTLGPLEWSRQRFNRGMDLQEMRRSLVEKSVRFWNDSEHFRRIDLEKGTVGDYAETLEKIAREGNWQVVVLAAAVSDYEPVARPGKMASDADEIQLVLKRTPKVIESVRGWVGPKCLLVGFKLTSGATDAEMAAIARAACIKNQADFTLVNDQSSLNAGRHRVALVNAGGVAEWFDPGDEMAAGVVHFLMRQRRKE